MAGYERLSFLDTSFLAMEDRNSHFHVAALMTFDADGLQTSAGGVDVDRIREFIASKLHLVPRYRQRLMWVPIENHPVWVDDEHFDLSYHVRHTHLPEPGADEDLKRLAARIFSEKLDRWRPLWELWIVEGLEGGGFALIAKAHHCMVDGIAGIDILKVLLNFYPTTEIDAPPDWQPQEAPTPRGLLIQETTRRAMIPLRAMRGLVQLPEEIREISESLQLRLAAMRKALGSGWLHNASPTPLNERIGPNRRFDWLRTDLAVAKAIKNATGSTINDVVLATVAGAVRRYLVAHDVEVDDLDFRAMAPVSVRTDGSEGELGNQVAMWLVDLPVYEPEPLERLRMIQAKTQELKDTNQALGAISLVQAGSFTPATLLSMAARVVASSGPLPFNLTVTNLPGPQVPIYLLEAKMRTFFPLVPLWVNHGVGVALFSYDGAVLWGLNADAESVHDLDEFAKAMEASFRELYEAAVGG